jgi:hypothetical protein
MLETLSKSKITVCLFLDKRKLSKFYHDRSSALFMGGLTDPVYRFLSSDGYGGLF